MQGKKLVGQNHLVSVIKDIFPNNRVIVGAKKVAGIPGTDPKTYLEVDVWLPELHLAFEYQESHHYEDTWYTQANLAELRRRDSTKAEVIHGRGDTIIHVPHWWDGSRESLIATVRQHRIDLLQDYNTKQDPIPSVPTFAETPSVPDIGSLMLPSFAQELPFEDHTWWLGEKFDGVRVCWNCIRKFLYNRAGKVITCPESVSSHFPCINLDGEIWLGRGNYAELAAARDHSLFSPNTLLNVFDSPPSSALSHSHPSLDYKSRYSLLLSNIHTSHPFINIAPCYKCTSKEKLKEFVKWVVESGGEGAVARVNGSLYESGRSSSLVKLKVSRDMDGLVLDTNIGETTCELKLLNGQKIIAKVPPSLISQITFGDIVSFTHNPKPIPNEPNSYYVFRKRNLLDWCEMHEQNLNAETEKLLLEKTNTKPKGYWTSDGNKNMRRAFDEFATSLGLDPKDPNTWYKIGTQEILSNIEGTHSIMMHYKGSFKNALLDLYPDIGLELQKFDFVPSNYWLKRENRIEAFSRAARKMGFDPLVADNWYNVSRRELERHEKGVHYMLRDIYGTLRKALFDLFPSIGLDNNKFPKKNYWNERDYRKEVFDRMADLYLFDALKAEDWMLRRSYMMANHEDFRHVLNFYKYSLRSALQDIYPTMDWKNTKKSWGM